MQKTSRLAFAAIFLSLAALSTGCAALNVKQPKASFRSANVAGVTAEGVTVNFDLDVENPNTVTVPLSAARYKVSLSGVQVLDEEAKPKTSLAAQSSTPVRLPVTLNFKQMLQAEKALAGSGGNVPYAFDGALDFSMGQQVPFNQAVTVPVHFKGTLSMKDALQAALSNPSILTDPSARKVIEAVLGKFPLGDLLGQ